MERKLTNQAWETCMDSLSLQENKLLKLIKHWNRGGGGHSKKVRSILVSDALKRMERLQGAKEELQLLHIHGQIGESDNGN